MTCAFCGSRISSGDHRCGRCGRKPNDTLTGEFPLHRTEGQLAMQLEPRETAPEPRREFRRPYQPSLFQAGNVIPIESYAPVEPPPRPRTETAQPKTRQPRRGPRAPEGQCSLDFMAAAPLKPRTL